MGVQVNWFLIWLLSSILLDPFLRNKFPFYKENATSLNLLGYSIIFLLVHKTTVFVLKDQEIVFFVLSLLFFGFFLLSFVTSNKERKHEKMFHARTKKRTKKEKKKVRKIAAQSQHYHFLKKHQPNSS